MEGCNHPDSQQYRQMRMEAVGVPPIGECPPMGVRKKIIRFVMRCVPKDLLVPGVGILHAYLKPWSQSFKMRKCAQEIE